MTRRDTLAYTVTKITVGCISIWLLAILFDAGLYANG